MAAELFTEPLGNCYPAHLHRCCSHFWGVCKLSSSKFTLGFTEDSIWTQKISNIWIHGHERSTAAQLGASLGGYCFDKRELLCYYQMVLGSTWCEDNKIFTWMGLESWSWYEKSVSELRIDTGAPQVQSKNKQGYDLFTKIINFSLPLVQERSAFSRAQFKIIISIPPWQDGETVPSV